MIRDPLYVKMDKAFQAVKENQFTQAKTFLGQIEKNLRDKMRNYPTLSEKLKPIFKKYTNVMDMVQKSDPRAASVLHSIMEELKDIGPEINKLQLVHF